MKTIIAGGRKVTDRELVFAAIKNSGFAITEVVSGGAQGADRIGESWAKQNGIPIKRFRPDWQMYRKAAGPMRNREMAEYADALIAVWDGASRGTKSMIEHAERNGLKVHVERVGVKETKCR